MESERNLMRFIEENPHELSQEQMELVIDDIFNDERKRTIHDETFDYLQWMNNRKCRQQIFGEYLVNNYSKFLGKEILEVGCGRTMRLSRMLKHYFRITAIDPKIEYRSEFCIKHIKGEFTENTQINIYDLVIALEPCDATEHIVRACVKAKKDFIVVLCGVPHKRIDGVMPEDEKAWYNYLISIDENFLVLERLNNPDFSPYIIRSK